MLQRSPCKALDRLGRARLYVILTSHLCKRPILETARLALKGGADMLQLREKDMPDADFLRLALELRELTARMGRLFIVNDRHHIALESGADGVHLGQGDMPISEARKLLGKDFIIGLSTHSLEQVEMAYKQGADYIGIGPISPTQTKPKERPVGTEILYKMKDLPIPCFVVGGITLTNLSEVTGAGVGRVAVCSAVISQDDVLNTTRLLSQALRSGRGTLQRAPTL
ncbi:MAG TPA: thiamine phosphate synthase [Candidatus Tripitaka californicus]|uniref:thiamine phosphate synthase n=1 Tax=Candidatus Tripitaka californicus TaxID=3367616 RepID=UPI00402A40D9|nr:thiamine phosphate synthase [Planctomycetota bacterium]